MTLPPPVISLNLVKALTLLSKAIKMENLLGQGPCAFVIKMKWEWLKDGASS